MLAPSKSARTRTTGAGVTRGPTPRRAVVKMAPYNPPLEGRGEKLRLDFNENVSGCSPKVLGVLRNATTREFVATYPEYEAARQRLAAHLGVTADQLIIGAGTDEVINAVMHAYVDPGEEVIVLKPSFSMFTFYAELVGGVPRPIPYRPPDLSFPVDEIVANINPRTRAICIASPNNPTAGVVNVGELRRVLEAADGCAVLVDEAYFDFHGESMLDLLPEWPNLFVSRTFSKAYGMAGLRIGMMASQPANAAIVRKGQSPYGVNALAIRCALAAIDDRNYVREYVRQVLQARQLLCAAFDEMGIRYWPSHANFVLFELGDRVNSICTALAERGILIRDQSRHIAGTVRVTVGPLQDTVRFLATLKEVMARCMRT